MPEKLTSYLNKADKLVPESWFKALADALLTEVERALYWLHVYGDRSKLSVYVDVFVCAFVCVFVCVCMCV